jgi:methylmalonyl-CoA mutase N-terminal domain/subunit
LPTEDSARIAIRTQQIIAYESGVTDTVDPLAGSYFIEHLTDAVEREAFEYIEKVDKMGGAVEAVKNKYFQNEIARSAYDYQQKVERQDAIIVGLNKFSVQKEPPQKLLHIDEKMVTRQKEAVQAVRSERDEAQYNSAMEILKKAASGSENLMPAIIGCVEAYATVGEISNALRDVFGEYQE